mgnify:CR=1 FL=1
MFHPITTTTTTIEFNEPDSFLSFVFALQDHVESCGEWNRGGRFTIQVRRDDFSCRTEVTTVRSGVPTIL